MVVKKKTSIVKIDIATCKELGSNDKVKVADIVIVHHHGWFL